MLVHSPKSLIKTERDIIFENSQTDAVKLQTARNICRKFYAHILQQLNIFERQKLKIGQYKKQANKERIYIGNPIKVFNTTGYSFCFKVDSYNIKIVLCQIMPDGGGEWGAYDSDTKTIYVRFLTDNGLDLEAINKIKSKRYILIHEIIHFLDDIEKENPEFFNYQDDYYNSEAEINTHFYEFIEFINPRILRDIEYFKDLSAFNNRQYVENLIGNILFGNEPSVNLSDDYDEWLSLRAFYLHLNKKNKESFLDRLVNYYTDIFKDIKRNWHGKNKTEKIESLLSLFCPLLESNK